MTVKRTRLCYWIARPAKPGVQSSNISRVCFTVISHTPLRSGFYHIQVVDRRNCDRSLSIEFDTTKLHIFQICNLFHCIVESWWNMPFKGTRHGDGVVHGAVAMLLRLWKHAATIWHHAAWIRIVTSHNAWMGYEYSLPKQWGMCDNGVNRPPHTGCNNNTIHIV